MEAKETCYTGKRDLHRGDKDLLYRQKRPALQAKETYIEAIETYYGGKRDLL
jgi:hypothetical protein